MITVSEENLTEVLTFVALQYHSGWAQSHKVTLISSNYHDVDQGGIGSGVYGPSGFLRYVKNVKEKWSLIPVW